MQSRAVTSTGSLRFGTITNPMEIALTDTGGVYDFAGSLVIEDDLDALQTVFIHGHVTSVAFIDLKNHNVAGTLVILSGGAGEVRNVGQVLFGGVVGLTQFANTSFNGTATIAGVPAGGKVETRNGGSVRGTITVNGNMAGAIDVTGSLSYPGLISVTGSLQVGGEIGVSNICNGDVDIAGNTDGSITIGGRLDSRGRILIDGLCDGPISIGEETVSSSQIVIRDGIDDNGSITINSVAGDFNANGDIAIGLPGSILVTYDGCILIRDNGIGAFGNLEGDIVVGGCHATGDDLTICVDGSINGTLAIKQAGCPNQVTHSCVGGCP